jgi:hypothetical protein
MGWKSIFAIGVASFFMAFLCLSADVFSSHPVTPAGIFALTHVGVLAGWSARVFRKQEERIRTLELQIADKNQTPIDSGV